MTPPIATRNDNLAEPIVLLPGAMCDVRLYWDALVRFSGRHAVQVIPLACAETVADLALSVLRVAPARFALAGLGLGGAVALEVARRAPDRLYRLALISTDPLAETPQTAGARELRILAAQSGRMEESMALDVPDAALAPGPDRPAVRRLMREMALSLGRDVYMRQARAMQKRPDQQKTLRRLLLPTLVLCGMHDSVVLPRRQQFTAELIPRARYVALGDAGHLPPLERPRETGAALADWLAQPSVLG